MFITIWILLCLYFFKRGISYVSKIDCDITWQQLPKGDGKIRISHTIKPDNPPSEEEWQKIYIKPYLQIYNKK